MYIVEQDGWSGQYSFSNFLWLCTSLVDVTPNGNSGETFWVIQWLRHCAPSAGDQGSIPGQGTRSHMSQQRPKILMCHN